MSTDKTPYESGADEKPCRSCGMAVQACRALFVLEAREACCSACEWSEQHEPAQNPPSSTHPGVSSREAEQ